MLALGLALALAAPSEAPAACLLASAVRTGGSWVLKPAFHLPPPCPSPEPPPPGAPVLEGRSRTGEVLFQTRTPLFPMAGKRGEAASAAAVVPLTSVERDALASLQLIDGGRTVASRRPSGAGGPARAAAVRRPDGLEVRWDARAWPFALARDAATGQALGEGEGGRLRLKARAGGIELLLSDGVRGKRVILAPRRAAATGASPRRPGPGS